MIISTLCLCVYVSSECYWCLSDTLPGRKLWKNDITMMIIGEVPGGEIILFCHLVETPSHHHTITPYTKPKP